MSHKYSHIRNLDDLNREMALLRIRKQIIVQEAVHSVSQWRRDFESRFALLRTVLSTMRSFMAHSQLQDAAQRKGVMALIAGIASAVASLWMKWRK